MFVLLLNLKKNAVEKSLYKLRGLNSHEFKPHKSIKLVLVFKTNKTGYLNYRSYFFVVPHPHPQPDFTGFSAGLSALGLVSFVGSAMIFFSLN